MKFIKKLALKEVIHIEPYDLNLQLNIEKGRKKASLLISLKDKNKDSFLLYDLSFLSGLYYWGQKAKDTFLYPGPVLWLKKIVFLSK